MPDISIVTLNTWKGDGDYRRRMVATVDLLAGLEPDIVLLQEAFAVPSRRISTAKTLSSALGLHCAYHPAREKTRSFEGQDVLSQSGLAVLARNQILSSRAVTVPADARDGERIARPPRSLVLAEPMVPQRSQSSTSTSRIWKTDRSCAAGNVSRPCRRCLKMSMGRSLPGGISTIS
tara:strand:- start:1745 stop:2275 length:531 start_codon:yes stop_codon:yes gene_type:complete